MSSVPIIAWGVLAYAAGLFVGFAGARAWCGLALVAVVAIALLGRRARAAAVAAVALAGLLTAAAREASDAACRRSALVRREWKALLLEDAHPGTLSRAIADSGDRCAGLALRLVVTRGRGAAGEVVTVGALPTSAHGWLLLEQAAVTPTGRSSMLVSARDRVGRTIDRLFRGDAPLVRALLIADESELDPELRDRFAAAGLVHMLSISGMHVAIIAGAVEMLLLMLRLSRVGASLLGLLVTAAYVTLIGLPPPAVRAGVMLGVGALCRLRGRPTSPWAALALGAAGPLAIDGRNVLDLGFQLSVVGIVGLIASGALARRLRSRLERWPLLRGAAARALLASTVASLVSAPLVTWQFGRLSLIAPLSNLVAAPLIALAQPALFLAVAVAPLHPVAALVADGAHPLLAALDGVARGAAALPFASVVVAPSLATELLLGAATACAVAACVAEYPLRPAAAALAFLVAACWLPALRRGPGVMELHLIDVGQGDAIALRTPRGRWLLMDAGRSWDGGDDGRRVVVPYLRRRGGEVAALMLSHPHADHVGGAGSVIRALHPAGLWDGAFPGGDAPYFETLAAARAARVPWHRVHPGDSLVVDGVVVRFLAPDSAWLDGVAHAAARPDVNETSVVALVRYGAVRFLLTGDAERGEEGWLLAHAREELGADVLKVGHHGSATSTTPEFLDAVRPRLALVSVGAGNRYGHPSAAVIGALARSGATVLRTDRQGSVVVRTDGRTLTVDAGGEQWTVGAGSRPPSSTP